MTEAAFRTKLIKLLKPYGHVQRIETTTGNGVPDLNFCSCICGEVWMELKDEAEKPTKLQMLWLNTRRSRGGVTAWAQAGSPLWKAYLWDRAVDDWICLQLPLTEDGITLLLEALDQCRQQNAVHYLRSQVVMDEKIRKTN